MSTALLALIADSVLRADVDRVAAAAGLQVVYAAEPSSRAAWSGATAVLLDVAAAQACAARALPRRAHVLLVGRSEPQAAEWHAAVSVGAQQLLTLPGQDHQLMAALADAAQAARGGQGRGPVIAVVPGRGGAGASVFAAALAQTAGHALLVDADPWGGGIDLVLGSEADGGLRWPDLDLQGGRLDFPALRDALPRHRGVSVLSGGRAGCDLEAGALTAVVDAGSRGGATVVCDVPRRSTGAVEAVLAAADLVVVVAAADVRSCAAAATLAPWLIGLNANVGLLVRGPAPGGLRGHDVAGAVGLPLLAAMRPQSGVAAALERGGLRLGRFSPLAAAARRVLRVARQHPAVHAA